MSLRGREEELALFLALRQSSFCFTTGLTNVSITLEVHLETAASQTLLTPVFNHDVGQAHIHLQYSIAEAYLPYLPGEGKPGLLCLGDIHLSVYFIINLVS